jgi:hypothetical protein
MCQFASMVLDKEHEYYLSTSNSHSDIIEHYKLREIHPNGIDANILRVEITPPGDNPKAPIDQWNYRVDQDIMPQWFEPAECENRARAALARRAAEERWLCDEIGSQVTVGYAGTATAGARGTATAGYAGEIRIRYYDPKCNRYRTAIAYTGEDGIEANMAYILDENHRFVKKS